MIDAAKNAIRQIGAGRLAKGLVTVFALIALGYWAKSFDFEGWAKWIDFSPRPDGAWYQGRSGFLLAGLAFTAIGGPRQVVAFFAAWFFGLWQGFLVSMAAIGLSCAMVSLVSRLLGRHARKFVRGRIDMAFDVWRNHPVATTIVVRLLPVGSNLVTNIAAGAMGVPLAAFIAGSIIGYMPQMAIFALMGTGVEIGAKWQIALGVGLFIALTIFSLWIYSRYRRQITVE